MQPVNSVRNMSSDLKKKVALVTGAGRGTGRTIAQALSERGAALAVNDITPINLDETVVNIRASGGQVRSYVSDIAKKMPVQGLVRSALEDFGRLDILVNCAEVKPRKTVLEMDDWDWQRTLDVNLTGAFLLTQVAGRVMREQGGGVIVHCGGPLEGPGRSACAAGRAGLEAFAAAARLEWEGSSVRILFIPSRSPDFLARVLSACGAR